jgi:hypothetical protein
MSTLADDLYNATLENRTPIISRVYEKGSQHQGIFIYIVSGPQIAGTVFQFVIYVDNVEQQDRRLESGNKYEIRRKFLNHLLDLNEDSWNRINASTLNPQYGSFFEPEHL